MGWRDTIDRYWIGILLGLLMPLGFLLLYLEQMNMWYMVAHLGLLMGPVWSKLFMLSVFPNMALIFVFYTMDTWRLSKGVLIGALPYMLAAIIATL